MKKTLRFITTILLSAVILVSPLCSYEKAQAASLSYYGLSTTDCGTDYVNYVKDSGLAVYASKGVTATSGKRFKTVGVTVVCDDTGESKSFRVDDGIFSKDSEENSDGNTYTACIVNMQKAFDSGYFPKAKARYDSNRQIRFHMDSIMITTYNGYNEGWIDSDGNRSYGTVYYDAYSIYNVSPGGGWGTLANFNTYFDKEFVAWNGKAQVPDTTPYVRGMNLLKGYSTTDTGFTTPGYYGDDYTGVYFKPNDGIGDYTNFWVKPNMPFEMGVSVAQVFNGSGLDKIRNSPRSTAYMFRDQKYPDSNDYLCYSKEFASYSTVNTTDPEKYGYPILNPDYTIQDNNMNTPSVYLSKLMANTTVDYGAPGERRMDTNVRMMLVDDGKDYDVGAWTGSNNGRSSSPASGTTYWSGFTKIGTAHSDGKGPEFTLDNYSSSKFYNGKCTFYISNIKDVRGDSGDMEGVGLNLTSFKYCMSDLVGPGNPGTPQCLNIVDGKASFDVDLDKLSESAKSAKSTKFYISGKDLLGNTTVTYYNLKLGDGFSSTCDLTKYTYKDPTSLDRWVGLGQQFEVISQVTNESGNTKQPEASFTNLKNENNSFSTLMHLTTGSAIPISITGYDYTKGLLTWTGNSSSGLKQASQQSSKLSYNSLNGNVGFISSNELMFDSTRTDLNNSKFDVSSIGYRKAKDSDPAIVSEESKEVDGEKICVDAKSPSITEVASDRDRSATQFTLALSDLESGLSSYKVDTLDTNTNEVTGNLVNWESPNDTKVSSEKKVISVYGTTTTRVSVTATDNVGNVTTQAFDLKPVVSEISLTSNVGKTNFGREINPSDDDFHMKSSKADRIVNYVNANGKFVTEPLTNKTTTFNVYAGQIGSSIVSSNTGTTRASTDFYGRSILGLKETGVFDPNKNLYSLTSSFYTDDTVNTEESSVITYDKDSRSLNWTAINDVEIPYYYSMESLDTDKTNGNVKQSSIPLTVANNWSSGNDHYTWKIYSGSYSSVDALKSSNASPVRTEKTIIDKSEGDSNSYAAAIKNLPTGMYTATVTMYDYNGNPSGTGICNFEYVATVPEIALEVTAVKDVKWEGVGPFIYSTIDSSGVIVDGKDKALFPLTQNAGYDIAKGYAVNYKISTTKGDPLTSLKVNYKCVDNTGGLLVGKVNDVTLDSLDSSSGTYYASQSINTTTPGSLLTNLDSGTSIMLKHFIPVNTVFYSGSTPYTGKVTVEAEFTLSTSSESKSTKVELYSFTQDRIATDDVSIDKQR